MKQNEGDRIEERLTESILDEVVEGVPVAVVGKPVVARGELLEALRRDRGEVALELRVLGQDHRPTRHEAVDQRLLPHLPYAKPNPTPNPRPVEGERKRGGRKKEGRRGRAKEAEKTIGEETEREGRNGRRGNDFELSKLHPPVPELSKTFFCGPQTIRFRDLKLTALNSYKKISVSSFYTNFLGKNSKLSASSF